MLGYQPTYGLQILCLRHQELADVSTLRCRPEQTLNELNV